MRPTRPAEAPEPRPRGRTTLMIAGAALLGVAAGTCTGYVIQAGRAPTALPPLSQPVVGQADGEAEPLSAAQDRRVKTDGDLRKLLITRPKRAKDSRFPVGRDGWADLASYAGEYKSPAERSTAAVPQGHRGGRSVPADRDPAEPAAELTPVEGVPHKEGGVPAA
ncbi:hypothetical protein [Streptomyces sp. NPDC012616]|uniref:hypothetical protein n=1 Tax=Streptomyces sp. NPDC012616 TaxID=3364840 RepID=UPI0036E916B5